MIIVYWIAEVEKFIRYSQRHIALDGNNSTHFTVMTGRAKILGQYTDPENLSEFLLDILRFQVKWSYTCTQGRRFFLGKYLQRVWFRREKQIKLYFQLFKQIFRPYLKMFKVVKVPYWKDIKIFSGRYCFFLCGKNVDSLKKWSRTIWCRNIVVKKIL